MFSKALFKQSAKANWIKWASVTIATSVMIAIVIIVLGNLAINDIRDSLKDIFVQADQESELKENATELYDLYLGTAQFNSSAETLTNAFVYSNIITPELINPYDTQVTQDMSIESKITIASEISQSFIEKYQSMLPAGSDTVMMQDLIVKVLLAHDNDATLTKKPLFVKGYYDYVYETGYKKSLEKGDTIEVAQIKAQEAVNFATKIIESDTPAKNDEIEAQQYVNNYLYENVLKEQKNDGKTEEEANKVAVTIKVISNTAISTYRLWLNEGYTNKDARIEATKSISDQLPEKVAEALTELGEMDMYGLIIGSIFYRIAGLLLPLVFVIMVANGLLAGQVDSGSMAYVLSTPTKRRTVTCTQMAYLIFAIFSMFAIVTAVSVLSVWIVGGNSYAINFAEILLFNAGAFLTIFAFAGFCFMCSALFNRTKHSLSIGGGLSIFMLVCTILGLFGSEVVPSAMRISAMNVFNYLSIITFFDTVSILDGTLAFLWKFGILLGIGIICFIIGIFRFDKKDLPL